MVELGYCDQHGVVPAEYEWLCGTWHCSKCFKYVDKPTPQQLYDSNDLVYRSMIDVRSK